MKNKKSIWEKIEIYAMYGVLFAYFFLELISLFVPLVRNYMDNSGAQLFIAIMLLFIFRNIHKTSQKSDSDIVDSGSFPTVLKKVLSNRQKYKSIDIYAHAGDWYYLNLKSICKDTGLEIRNMRILLRDMNDSEKLIYPDNKDAKEDCKTKWRSAIDGFSDLFNEGKGMIKNLSFAYYRIEPNMHFMIIDKKIAFFGIYEPRIDSIGAEAAICYAIKPRTEHGYQFIYSLEDFFERNWANYETEESFDKAQKYKDENKMDEALKECNLALSNVPKWKRAILLKNEILKAQKESASPNP
jgi:hypothetical protein